MAQTAIKNTVSPTLGRKLLYGAAALIGGYILLVIVFPRVFDGMQYHSFNSRLGGLDTRLGDTDERLGNIEKSVAILLDRLGNGPDGVAPREASYALGGGGQDERLLMQRLEDVTVALENLRAALEAQTAAVESMQRPMGTSGSDDQ